MKISNEAAMAAGRGVLAVLGGSVDLTKGDVREQYGRAALEAARPYLERSDSEELPAPSAMPDREALRKLMRDALDAYVKLGPKGYYVYLDSILALIGSSEATPGCTDPSCRGQRRGYPAASEVPSDQPCLGDGVRDRKVAEPPRGCLGDGVCTNPKCPVHGIKEEPSDSR